VKRVAAKSERDRYNVQVLLWRWITRAEESKKALTRSDAACLAALLEVERVGIVQNQSRLAHLLRVAPSALSTQLKKLALKKLCRILYNPEQGKTIKVTLLGYKLLLDFVTRQQYGRFPQKTLQAIRTRRLSFQQVTKLVRKVHNDEMTRLLQNNSQRR